MCCKICGHNDGRKACPALAACFVAVHKKGSCRNGGRSVAPPDVVVSLASWMDNATLKCQSFKPHSHVDAADGAGTAACFDTSHMFLTRSCWHCSKSIAVGYGMVLTVPFTGPISLQVVHPIATKMAFIMNSMLAKYVMQAGVYDKFIQ